jgi:hypothetical protein
MSSHGRSGGALIRPQHRNLISNKNHNCNVSVQPRAIRADVLLRKIEGVFFIIDVSDLKIPIHRIEDLRTQADVFDFRAPNAFQPHWPFSGA